jgi:hypothetical protein
MTGPDMNVRGSTGTVTAVRIGLSMMNSWKGPGTRRLVRTSGVPGFGTGASRHRNKLTDLLGLRKENDPSNQRCTCSRCGQSPYVSTGFDVVWLAVG